MGILSLLSPKSSVAPQFQPTVDEYQRLRPIRLRLNHQLTNRFSRDVIEEGAKKLGMFHRGTIVMDCEDQLAVLMDYCLFDVRRRGRNAIEQYLCDSPPPADSGEMVCLKAMQNATYTMLAVRDIEPGVGCYVQNLFTEETHLLVDNGLSQTAKRGLVMVTRILDFDSYIATSGAALPIGIMDAVELEEFQQRMSVGTDVGRFDPAPYIRRAIRNGAMDQVRFQGVGGEDFEGESLEGESRLDPTDFAPPPTHSSRRKRSAGKTKPAANRRCRCGSGKMVKNCCGKK